MAQGTEGENETNYSPRYLRELVERICASPGFRNSKRARDFLEYVCQKVIAGETGEIHERQIANSVFGRLKKDYDPSVDNAVRVLAGVVRRKLAQYFAGNGIGESVILEIPKGSYVPIVVPRNAPSGTGAVTIGVREAAPADSSRFWRWACVASLAALAISFAVNAALFPLFMGSDAAGLDGGGALISMVVHPGEATLVVVPDTGHVVAQVLTGKSLPLDTYGEAAYRNALFGDKTLASGRDFWGYMISRRFTDIYSADFYGRLVRSIPLGAGNIELRHPRTLHLQDFVGRNAIILGSPRSNPWVEAFAEQLTFRFQAQNGAAEYIASVQPNVGEPDHFLAEPLKLGSGVALGVLSVIPNPYPPGRLMFIAGTEASVTDAIGRAAVTSDGLEHLSRELRVKDASELGRLETVVSAQVLGANVKEWKVIASRIGTK